jgi:hypothetical protein
MRAHIVRDGTVENTIEIEALDTIEELGPFLLDASLGGKKGDLWDGTTFTTPPPSAEELAAIKEAEDIAAAKAYTKLKALQQMSPAQVQTWVAANVTNLAQAQDAIATLAIAVSILSRRL